MKKEQSFEALVLSIKDISAKTSNAFSGAVNQLITMPLCLNGVDSFIRCIRRLVRQCRTNLLQIPKRS